MWKLDYLGRLRGLPPRPIRSVAWSAWAATFKSTGTGTSPIDTLLDELMDSPIEVLEHAFDARNRASGSRDVNLSVLNAYPRNDEPNLAKRLGWAFAKIVSRQVLSPTTNARERNHLGLEMGHELAVRVFSAWDKTVPEKKQLKALVKRMARALAEILVRQKSGAPRGRSVEEEADTIHRRHGTHDVWPHRRMMRRAIARRVKKEPEEAEDSATRLGSLAAEVGEALVRIVEKALEEPAASSDLLRSRVRAIDWPSRLLTDDETSRPHGEKVKALRRRANRLARVLGDLLEEVYAPSEPRGVPLVNLAREMRRTVATVVLDSLGDAERPDESPDALAERMGQELAAAVYGRRLHSNASPENLRDFAERTGVALAEVLSKSLVEAPDEALDTLARRIGRDIPSGRILARFDADAPTTSDGLLGRTPEQQAAAAALHAIKQYRASACETLEELWSLLHDWWPIPRLAERVWRPDHGVAGDDEPSDQALCLAVSVCSGPHGIQPGVHRDHPEDRRPRHKGEMRPLFPHLWDALQGQCDERAYELAVHLLAAEMWNREWYGDGLAAMPEYRFWLATLGLRTIVRKGLTKGRRWLHVLLEGVWNRETDPRWIERGTVEQRWHWFRAELRDPGTAGVWNELALLGILPELDAVTARRVKMGLTAGTLGFGDSRVDWLYLGLTRCVTRALQSKSSVPKALESLRTAAARLEEMATWTSDAVLGPELAGAVCAVALGARAATSRADVLDRAVRIQDMARDVVAVASGRARSGVHEVLRHGVGIHEVRNGMKPRGDS